MIEQDGLDKLIKCLDFDIKGVHEEDKLKCGFLLMYLTTNTLIFDASIKAMKALIIREANL